MIGKQISNYTVTAHLGQGGMGNVYKAIDNMLGREVALKMLHPQLTGQSLFLERFRKEARILAQLLHPNIAVIYNFIEQDSDYYMVMEYVEGVGVDSLINRYQSLPASLVVPIATQALEGLQHAHYKNVFHRDIKPANLMITKENLMKLMDFGIAKVSGEQKLTQVNKIVGTIEFMAPELIEGKDASALSDIYSMGATMYEMLTGRIPFESESDYNLMQLILKSKPTPPEKINAQIPKQLSDIVMKAMDKNPAKRFVNAKEFQSALLSAFPNYRNINLESLSSGAGALETRVAMLDPETRVESSIPVVSQMKNWLTDPQGLTRWKEQLVSKRKWLLLLLLLFLGITGYFLLRPGPKKSSETLSTVDTPKTSETSGSGRNPYETPLEAEVPPSGRGVMPQPVDGGNTPQPTEPAVPRKKETTPDKPSQKEKKVKEEPAEPAKPKSVVTYGRNTVVLRLSSHVDMNQERKSVQSVTFRVVRPVYQNGVMIIAAGATATGSITVGRVRTDITIDQVETVTGKRIPVKSEKAHGRRGDLENGTTFTATILPGSTIHFGD